MRILIIQPIKGGSVPIAEYCFRALKQLGMKSYLFPGPVFENLYDFMKHRFNHDVPSSIFKPFMQLVNSLIYSYIEEFRPDIIFGIAQSPLFQEILSLCKRKGITKVFWFVEDCNRYTYWKDIASNYDFFFIIQREPYITIINRLCPNVSYLPLAADPEIHRPMKLSSEEEDFFGSDISFVGAGYPNRISIFEQLNLKELKIWGSDWNISDNSPIRDSIQLNGARVATDDYVKIFNASKINLNLHSSTEAGVLGKGDFVNPRTFEVSACRAFQLVDERTLLRELFDESEIVTFGNIKDLKNKIQYFLSDDSARKEFSTRAYRRVTRQHTYLHRMTELIKILESKA